MEILTIYTFSIILFVMQVQHWGQIKASESDAYSDTEFELEKGNDRGKNIIDAKPNATISTTNIQKEEPEYSEEEEHLFHSQVWVKGSPL